LPSGKRFIDRLKAANIPYLFVTNNSTKNPADVAANLTKNHQIDNIGIDQIYTSAMATADLLETIGFTRSKTRVFIIGEIWTTKKHF
jgi:4-nitrophenyl phosphatase